MINMMKNEYNLKLTVSSSPHLVTDMSTSKIMRYVIISLLPALAVSTYVFGFRAVTLTAVCVISCVIMEYLFNLMVKRKQTIGDFSAVVTGMLLAYNLPSNFPYWMAMIGSFVAIVIVKQLFGGIGKNLVNPAITARVVLLVSFPAAMTSWPLPGTSGADAVTGATPLGILAEGGGSMPSNMDLFLGNVGGSMGEVSALALLIGFAFLLWKKIVSPIIPACYIGTVFIFALAAGQDPIFHVLAGGVVLGACFMATDYVTTPVLPLGKVIFGVGCGVVTMAIRLFGNYPEGVSYSILLMNILVPHIDNFCTGLIYKKTGKIREGAK